MTGDGRAVVSFPQRRELEETAEERYGTSLAVIRSAAEILRDTAELAPADRTRFATMILEAEAKLERRLDEMRRRGQAA